MTTVSILADEDFSDQEEQNISYETKDYTQHIFDPEPNLKREFTPHEAIQKFASRHFTTSLSSHGRGVWPPYYRGFMVLKVNPQILKGNLWSKKSLAQMKEHEKCTKTSHHRPQCAKWFSRYFISKSGI